MILPTPHDPRFITIRRGGTLQDKHHHLLALWAADCAEHVLPIFERDQPRDPRPRYAIAQARAWARDAFGELSVALKQISPTMPSTGIPHDAGLIYQLLAIVIVGAKSYFT